MNSTMPTSTAAKAPKACESTIRCGMAVMGMNMAMAPPINEPMMKPAMIHSQVMMLVAHQRADRRP